MGPLKNTLELVTLLHLESLERCQMAFMSFYGKWVPSTQQQQGSKLWGKKNSETAFSSTLLTYPHHHGVTSQWRSMDVQFSNCLSWWIGSWGSILHIILEPGLQQWSLSFISVTLRTWIFFLAQEGLKWWVLLCFWSFISVEMRCPAETKCMSSLSFPSPHFILYAGLYLQLLHSSHLPDCECFKKEINTGVQSKSLWGKDEEQNTAASTPR